MLTVAPFSREVVLIVAGCKVSPNLTLSKKSADFAPGVDPHPALIEGELLPGRSPSLLPPFRPRGFPSFTALAHSWALGESMYLRQLTAGDEPWTVELLSRAFWQIEPMNQLFQEPRAAHKLSRFMRCTFRYAIRNGEAFAIDESGVALWLLPGRTDMTPGRMLGAGMLSFPITLGARDARSFRKFVRHTARVHRQAMPHLHYYLFAIGVRPDERGKGVGTSLIRHLRERATAQRLPIYLETQSPKNMLLYQKLGFTVANDEPIEGLDLPNWGMIAHP
jgi:ribosomal protein S18 acetylase RimI-like enzyme